MVRGQFECFGDDRLVAQALSIAARRLGSAKGTVDVEMHADDEIASLGTWPVSAHFASKPAPSSPAPSNVAAAIDRAIVIAGIRGIASPGWQVTMRNVCSSLIEKRMTAAAPRRAASSIRLVRVDESEPFVPYRNTRIGATLALPVGARQALKVANPPSLDLTLRKPGRERAPIKQGLATMTGSKEFRRICDPSGTPATRPASKHNDKRRGSSEVCV